MQVVLGEDGRGAGVGGSLPVMVFVLTKMATLLGRPPIQVTHNYYIILYRLSEAYIYMLMRDEEGRKKEASKIKQTTRQSNTAHPRQSLFL